MGFSRFIEERPRLIWHNFWVDLRGQTGASTQPTATFPRGKLGRNSKVNIWPIPSWVFVGYWWRAHRTFAKKN